MQLPPYWQVTPIALVALTVGIGHEIGLRWLAHRQTPEHRRATRRRSWAFYAGLTGLILTKLDGDARGGAALSIKSVTGVPIKFVGTGEKTEDFETFHPDRLASRILGMGDVVSLVEKAQESIDEKEAEKMAESLRKSDFNLEDFLAQHDT